MTQFDRYIASAALRFFVFAAFGLTALFSLLELVEQLQSVGQGQYRLIDALVYVLLLAPSKLLQVAPVSMLLASLLGLGGLATTSELTALRALGVSEFRITISLIKLAVPILVTLFLTVEFVIPPAQQLAQTERTAKLTSSEPVHGGDGFWTQSDRQYLNVQSFGYGNVPKNINIYVFTANGTLSRYVHADRAVIRPDGTWLLDNVIQKQVLTQQFRTEYLSTLAWHSFLPQQKAKLLVLPPESMPPIELYRYVRDLELHHQPATRYQQELWAKISIPVSFIAMILIAMPFVFAPARAQNSGQQIAVGAIIGMIFTLIQQIGAHLDVLLSLDPAVVAMLPPLILMAAAIYLFRRTHR
ncbi:MAG: LPS export ABC transporter permease LptG [Alphaproteobacteria bacterium]|nr:LPS export ABC transporter permease LptG [Alphaproteobacteria bacterium]MBU6471388.1 LPS export ABC transporter permease LptG [Alphaproteobacteria bacterium]MDE2011745.1 LPS export ABC transporter permease LptG [Alphaproteobacteria bacterium]MDE2072959.1 LPS export ABC transporter permease LptG [Alphaproteobacteria bacterium]MDE2351837.1 LPS export ABC transporter permease LptG [Alphaproteobacteria bacterium]